MLFDTVTPGKCWDTRLVQVTTPFCLIHFNVQSQGFIQHCTIHAMVTVLLNSPRNKPIKTIINGMKEMLCGVHSVATALDTVINYAV
jgi:hypothetical protein